MTAVPRQSLSEAMYFEIELQSPVRHDFYLGEMFPMSGSSLAHDILVGNLYGLFFATLLGQPARMFTSNLGIRCRGGFVYSDGAIALGTPEIERHDGIDVVQNPAVVFEVLSKSTEKYDRGLKFQRYKAVPSFTEYVLVEQKKMLVEHHVKSAKGTWKVLKLKKATDVIELSGVKASISLSSLYAGVTFTDE